MLLAGPGLLAAAAGAGAAPAPQSVDQRVAFFEDFASGTLDPERWVLPTSWGLENARMKPWDFPSLPLNDTATPHLSDSLAGSPGGGRYSPSNRTWTETNWIDLSGASSTAQLVLYHRYDIDTSEDTALVFARTEVRGWTVIAPTSGYPTLNGFAGSSLVFSGTTFDLSSYVGSRLKVAFEIISGTNGVQGDGWQISSLQVTYATTETLPDFEATDLQLWDDFGGRLFGTATSGQAVHMVLQVRNGGSATPPRVAPVVFYDGPVGTGRLLGRADLLPIAPGAVGNTSIVAILEPGPHTLTAVVDPAGGTDELSRSNNAASTTITMDPPDGVDLVPLEFKIESGGRATSGARPGDALVANITLANLGSQAVSAPFSVGLYLRQSPNTTVLLQEQTTSLGLPAGGSRPVQLGFTAVAGDLTLVARVDTQGDIAELSESNNEVERRFPVAVDPGVDLTLTGTQILRGGVSSSDAVEGELVQIVTTVHNAGTSAIEEPFTVAAFLGDPDAGGTLVYSRRVAGGLLANQSVEVRGSWVAQIGVRVLYMYADYGREVFESDELNNKASDSTSVRADTRVNLAITDVAFTVLGKRVNETQVGAPVNITVTVSNLGIETDVNAYLSMSLENPWTFPGTFGIQTRKLPSTIPRAGQAQVTFPYTAQSGTHVFFFAADYALSVSESNEFDNLAVRTLSVSPDSPDIAVGTVSVKAQNIEVSTLYPQLNVTVQCEVTNAGVKEVQDPFTIEVWAGQPGELGSVRLHRQTVAAPFVVGDSVIVKVSWEAGFPTAGSQSIVVLADPNGSIVEADRSNNIGQKDVSYAATALPNLQVETVLSYRNGQLVSRATEGDTIEVRVVVHNASPVPFTAGTEVEARTSSSLVFSAPVARLEPGESREFSFNWSAEPGVQLRVSINQFGGVQESDYTDNTRDVQVQVSAVVQTPWALYGAAGGAAAAAVAVVLFLLVRRRRRRAPKEPEEGADEAAPGEPEEPGAAGEAMAVSETAPERPEAAAPGVAGVVQDSGAAKPAPSEPAEADTVAAQEADAGKSAPAPVEPAPAPAEPRCPSCNEPVEPDWQVCPHCEASLS